MKLLAVAGLPVLLAMAAAPSQASTAAAGPSAASVPAPAHYDSPGHNSPSHPLGGGAHTLPADLVTRSHALRSGSKATAVTSGNWAGYALTGGSGSYTNVYATWVQPQVSCTTDGIVAFWVGLDGYSSDAVEQTGTGVNCSSGTPQPFAWWETYPTNDIQDYDVTVEPGDFMFAEVYDLGNGDDDMTLTDYTQGWTETTVAAKPASANDSSAEAVTEAVTDGTITPLTDFVVSHFEEAMTNQGVFPSSATQINMSDPDGGSATTGATDGGGDFSTYFGSGPSPSYTTATQANNGYLWTDSPGTGPVNQGLGMAANTSPAITELYSGTNVTAFQANTGILWTDPGGDTGDAMAADTSPAITTLANDHYQVLYQAPGGCLSSYSPWLGSACLNLGMAAGTSPSATGLFDNSLEVAFQSNGGQLWVWNSNTGAENLLADMAPGTSPSIMALNGNGLEDNYAVAYHGSNGDLWVGENDQSSTGDGVTLTDTGLAMAPGTSPAVALSPSANGYSAQAQSSSGILCSYTLTSGSGGSNSCSGLGMAAGSSPAAAALPGGGYTVAWSAAGGDALWVAYQGAGDNLGLGMYAGTSPSVAG
jgi:hypothetical protein